MPKFEHNIEYQGVKTFKSDTIAGMFGMDIDKKLSRHWSVDIPIEDMEWSVGLIVGSSGSGKTTLAKHIFPDAKIYDGISHENWPEDKCLIDGFEEKDVRKITAELTRVGFGSAPNWLLPFKHVSNGEKFRAEVARLLVDTKPGETALVDEFTSVVDRHVAKCASYAIAKQVRATGKKLVAVSCHFDIEEWLTPDWIYNVDTGEFSRGSLRRPEIKLDIYQVHRKAWNLFRKYHYLNENMANNAQCFVAFLDGVPVAFASAGKQPHNYNKKLMKAQRTVVVPDYQGIGIGTRLSDFVAEHYHSQGYDYNSVTAHPAIVAYRKKSPKWVITRVGVVPPQGKTAKFKSTQTSCQRNTVTCVYVGDKGK